MIKPRINTIFAILIALTVLLLLYQFTKYNLLYFKHDLSVTLKLPQPGKFSAVGIEPNGAKHGLGTRVIEDIDDPVTFTYLINRAPLKTLVFNYQPDTPLASHEEFVVSALKIQTPFAKNVFAVDDSAGDYLVGGIRPAEQPRNHFRLKPDSESLVLMTSNINKINPWVQIAFPWVVSLLVFLLLRSVAWQNLPALHDLDQGRLVENKAEFDVLNGLRGISALLVLLAHSGPSGYFNLQLGLALLFVVSGFMLCKPFVLDNSKIYKASSVIGFWRKRILRILPMYYFTITLLVLSTFDVFGAVKHYLLLEAKGHLWAIPQIFFFYLILPLILVVTCFVSRYRQSLVLLLLGVCIAFHLPNYILPHHMFYNGVYYTHFYAAQFLLGVFVSYLYYGVIRPNKWWNENVDQMAPFVAAIGYILLFGFVLFVGPVFELPKMLAPIAGSFFLKSLVAAAIILAFAMLSQSSRQIFHVFVTNPIFRLVGIVGFSFYLLHGFSIELLEAFETQILNLPDTSRWSYVFFIKAALVTYIMSLWTYSYVERPFFGNRIKNPVRY